MKSWRPGSREPLPARAKELFGIELGARELDSFDRYLRVLEHWSARMNLVGTRSRSELVDRHLLDSLALARWARAARVVVDLGSGAGFPAVPLAVIAPDARFHLIESRGKRASFLRQVVRMVGLRNAEVYEAPAETWEGAADLVTGRAIAVDVLGAFALRVLGPGGRLAVMRKRGAPALDLPGFETRETLAYDLPAGERHEVAALEIV